MASVIPLWSLVTCHDYTVLSFQIFWSLVSCCYYSLGRDVCFLYNRFHERKYTNALQISWFIIITEVDYVLFEHNSSAPAIYCYLSATYMSNMRHIHHVKNICSCQLALCKISNLSTLKLVLKIDDFINVSKIAIASGKHRGAQWIFCKQFHLLSHNVVLTVIFSVRPIQINATKNYFRIVLAIFTFIIVIFLRVIFFKIKIKFSFIFCFELCNKDHYLRLSLVISFLLTSFFEFHIFKQIMAVNK